MAGKHKSKKKKGQARLKQARRSTCAAHKDMVTKITRNMELTIGMECKLGTLLENPTFKNGNRMNVRIHLPQFQDQTVSSPSISTWQPVDNQMNEHELEQIVRWESTIEVEVNHNVLMQLDNQPHIFFCVGSDPMTVTRCDTVKLLSTDTEEPEGDEEESPDDTPDDLDDTNKTKSVQYHMDGENEEEEEEIKERAPLTPEDEARIQTCADTMSTTVVQLHAVDLSALFDKSGEVSMTAFGKTTCGVNDARVYIKASSALLDVKNSNQRFAYNPLTVSVVSARPLPGIQVERDNPAMQSYITNDAGKYDNFMLLRKHCLPVYACAKIDRGFNQPPRIVYTQAKPQGATKVKWEHRTTILAGLINSDELAEQLENVPIVTWLHDRDVLHRRDGTRKELETWRQEYYRGKMHEMVNSLNEEQEERQREITTKQLLTYASSLDTTELDKYLCDRLWALSLERRTEQMHGEAKIGLDDLWCSSQEIVNHYRSRLEKARKELAGEEEEVVVVSKKKSKSHNKSAPPSPAIEDQEEAVAAAEGNIGSLVEDGEKQAEGFDATPDSTEEGTKEESEEEGKKKEENTVDEQVNVDNENNSTAKDVEQQGEEDQIERTPSQEGINEEDGNEQEIEPQTVEEKAKEKKENEKRKSQALLEECMNRPLSLDLRATVGPIKRVIGIGGDIEKSDLDISNDERIVRQPGMYFDQGTEIRVRATLAYPVFAHPLSVAPQRGRIGINEVPQQDTTKPLVPQRRAPFERWVVMMSYNNTNLLRRILNAIAVVNQKAFPSESLRSYQLSESERSAVDRAEMDVIAGFHIVDDDFRIIVLEGLGARGMSDLRKAIPRESWNTDDTMILSDPFIRFSTRLYTSFDTDLKMVRLRESLSILVNLPEIYNRNKVEPDCFDALMRLATMRSLDRLAQVAKNEIFPLVTMITKLESKYGESVSLEDITGFKDQSRLNPRALRKKKDDDETSNHSGKSKHVGGNQQEENEDGPDTQETHASAAVKRRKGATDQLNAEFEKHRRQWKARDFREEHKDASRVVAMQVQERRAAREELEENERNRYGGELFLYSGQKNNYKEIKLDEMRARLQKVPGATFTFSKEYQSLTFSLVNEGLIKTNEKQEMKRKFITKKGFVYPAPRDSMEARRDPNTQLSKARIDDLKHPWKGGLAAANSCNSEPVPRNQSGIEFSCIPTKDNAEGFGGYNEDGSRNEDFYTSVHLSGEGLAAEMQAAKVREQDEWNAKVVVKNLRLLPHFGNNGEKSIQIDKYKGILRGKPHKAALRSIRTLTMRNGQVSKLRTMPVSIMNPKPLDGDLDPMIAGKHRRQAAHAGMACNKGKGGNNGRPDMVRYINGAKVRPMEQQIICRRSIKPLESFEKMPPLFGSNAN